MDREKDVNDLLDVLHLAESAIIDAIFDEDGCKRAAAVEDAES